MFKFLEQLGRYFLMLIKVFSKPEKPVLYYKQTMSEIVNLGFNSVGIIAIIAFFMGAVVTLQSAYNTESPIYPTYFIGLACRDSILLEFSSTVAALIGWQSRIQYCI
jgi:phospholipid/cholesterol/gamma-HCH transport system permease protein